MTKARETIILTEAQREEWVKSFEATGKLPSAEIPCCKCKLGITATHGNLVSKIKKYQNITNLLTKFVCKDCNQITNAAKASEAPSDSSKSFKKQKLKKAKKLTTLDEIKDHEGRYNIPNVNLTNENKQSYTIDQIAANPTLAQEFTNNVCLRPVVYLNNDSTCDECNLFANCGCGVKRLSKAKLKSLNTQ